MTRITVLCLVVWLVALGCKSESTNTPSGGEERASEGDPAEAERGPTEAESDPTGPEAGQGGVAIDVSPPTGTPWNGTVPLAPLLQQVDLPAMDTHAALVEVSLGMTRDQLAAVAPELVDARPDVDAFGPDDSGVHARLDGEQDVLARVDLILPKDGAVAALEAAWGAAEVVRIAGRDWHVWYFDEGRTRVQSMASRESSAHQRVEFTPFVRRSEIVGASDTSAMGFEADGELLLSTQEALTGRYGPWFDPGKYGKGALRLPSGEQPGKSHVVRLQYVDDRVEGWEMALWYDDTADRDTIVERLAAKWGVAPADARDDLGSQARWRFSESPLVELEDAASQQGLKLTVSHVPDLEAIAANAEPTLDASTLREGVFGIGRSETCTALVGRIGEPDSRSTLSAERRILYWYWRTTERLGESLKVVCDGDALVSVALELKAVVRAREMGLEGPLLDLIGKPVTEVAAALGAPTESDDPRYTWRGTGDDSLPDVVVEATCYDFWDRKCELIEVAFASTR